MDLVPESERADWLDLLAEELDWPGPVYGVSATEGFGLRLLITDIMSELEGETEPE